MISKEVYFEAFILYCLSFYSELDTDRTFGRRDILKMLFFCCSYNRKLYQIFDNFYALPEGPVESDCYDFIKRISVNKTIFEDFLNNNFKVLKIFTSHDNKITAIDNHIKDKHPEIKSDEILIDLKNSLSFLNKNGLFKYDTQELINISHRYYSWIDAHNKAKNNGIRSYKMNIMSMYQEPLFLSLEDSNNG